MKKMQLVSLDFEPTLTLNEGANVVGREQSCDIQLDDVNVSKQHCKIECHGSSYVVRDLGSTNGTFVNGERATRMSIDPGNVVRIGPFQYTFEVTTATEKSVSEKSAVTKKGRKKPSVFSENLVAAASASSGETTLSGCGPESAGVEQVSVPQPVVPVPEFAPETPHQEYDTQPVTQVPARPRDPARSATVQESENSSSIVDFVTDNKKSVAILAVCGILALWVCVPWSAMTMPSDVALCEFYEGVLADVVMLRDAQAGDESWEALTSEVEGQNAAYVALLDRSNVSIPARQLLMAGRDYLPAVLSESRTQRTTSETLLRQKLTAARRLIGGVALTAGIVEQDKETVNQEDLMGIQNSMLGEE